MLTREAPTMTRKELMAAYKNAGKNFMTPRVLAKRVLVRKRTVVELSEGTDFARQPIYGVSVLTFAEDGTRTFADPDPSKMFRDMDEARRYFNDCV